MRVLRVATFCLVCVLGLSAWKFPTAIERAASDVDASYVLTDGRPAIQMKTANESLIITNCAYGIFRIGGIDFDPDLSLLVGDMLTKRFNNQLAGQTVVLKNFTIHLNNAAALRRNMAGMYTGLIPDLMNDQTKIGCSADDLRGGMVVSEAIPDRTPLIVVVDVQIGEKAYHARSVHGADAYPPRKKAPQEAKDKWNRTAGAAIGETLRLLGDSIATDVATTPEPDKAV